MSFSRILMGALLGFGMVATSAFARKTVPLQTAKVISQNIGTYDAGAAVMPVGTTLVGTRINVKENVVVLQTAKSRLTLQEFTRSPNWHHFIVLPVNGSVQFYQDGSWFIVVDSQHKKHKFSLLHLEQIQ